MATKPTDVFTWATDANFSSGPDSGNPTKANPPSWPNVAQGEVPGLKVVAAFTNKVRNVLGQWVTWLNAGSSAGAADAHLCETDATGKLTLAELHADAYDENVTFKEDIGAFAGVYIDNYTTPGVGGSDNHFHAQPGRPQTGAVENNDGGDCEIFGGTRGTGGSLTGGKGDGGAALGGGIVRGFGSNSTRIIERAESFDRAAAASPTVCMKLHLPYQKTTYLLQLDLVTVEDGGGASPKYSVERRIYSCVRDTSTIATGGYTAVHAAESYTGNAPQMSILDGGSGLLEIKVGGVSSTEDAKCTMYAKAFVSPVSTA
jgi:hypothetical protein